MVDFSKKLDELFDKKRCVMFENLTSIRQETQLDISGMYERISGLLQNPGCVEILNNDELNQWYKDCIEMSKRFDVFRQQYISILKDSAILANKIKKHNKKSFDNNN